jgi:foldase protein PrsA
MAEKKKTQPAKATTKVKAEVAKDPIKSLKPGRTPKSNLNAMILIGVLVLGGLLFLLRKQFVVAFVNGKPIMRTEYVAAMEKQVGKQALENLVIGKLIKDEAAKTGVSISQEELDAEITQIETQLSGQGQNLDAALETEGMTRTQLIEEIRMQKLVEKMASGEVEVTEEEIDKYLSDNKDFLPEDATEEELRDQAKSQLSSQNKNASIQDWISSLKVAANVVYW